MVPNAAAKSIVYYDCWLEQTQNAWSPKDPTNCEQSFNDVYKYVKQARTELRMKSVVDILENYPLVDVEEKFFPYKDMIDKDNEPYEGNYAEEMKETIKKAFIAAEERKAAELAKQEAAKAASSDNSATAGFIVDQSQNDNPEIVFLSYFGDKSFALSAAAKTEIDRSITEIKKVNPNLIIVNGHTDKSVDDRESLILSKRRADAVRDYLVQKGIPSKKIRSYGFGKTDSLVDNAEGEQVPGNRRAEISFRAP